MRWAQVKGYEGLYEVSESGEVRSVTRFVKQRSGGTQLKKGKPLRPAKDKVGYLKCSLSKANKLSTFQIHRLVASAFLLNPYNLPEVNHIDCDKSNNHISNLEWCDHIHNMAHAKTNNRIVKMTRDTHGKSVIKSSQIPFIIAWRKAGVQVSKLALMYGCSVDVIYRVTKSKI